MYKPAAKCVIVRNVQLQFLGFHWDCARSCIPFSQLPHSKHTAKVWEILRIYESFCRQYHYTSYPSSFKTVSHWLTQIMSSVKPATAKSYLGALKSFHVETGMSVTALKDPHLDLIIRGGQRLYGEHAKAVRCKDAIWKREKALVKVQQERQE